jgi:hypothetical protein
VRLSVGSVLIAVVFLFGLGVRAGEVPFAETFEGRPVGYLDGQNAWSAAPHIDVTVQTNTVYAGSKAVLVPTNAMVSRAFADATATNVWVDFSARMSPRPTGGNPHLSDDAVAGFYINSGGSIVARSNNTWVTLSGFTAETGTWYRFSVNLDYGARTWGIYAAGAAPNAVAEPIVTNLVFKAGATNTWFHAFRVKN